MFSKYCLQRWLNVTRKFLIGNAVVSCLIALQSTDIYFVLLQYILQPICAGEFSGYSNYSKSYGHGKQLINGLWFFFQAQKSSLPCWGAIWGLGPTLPYFVFNRNCSFICRHFMTCRRNKGPYIQVGAFRRLIIYDESCQSHPLLVWWSERVPCPKCVQARLPSESRTSCGLIPSSCQTFDTRNCWRDRQSVLFWSYPCIQLGHQKAVLKISSLLPLLYFLVYKKRAEFPITCNNNYIIQRDHCYG